MPISRVSYRTLIMLVVGLSITLYANDARFGARVDLGLVESDLINEASGIAASRKNPDVVWTHNDSGDQNRIYALNARGKHLGVYTLEGASATDWEDMAVGPGPVDGEHYLYIGDIGDNESQRDLKRIYRAREPIVDSSQAPIMATIFEVEAITFRYPDGRPDAETLMVDPLTRDIYIVSKGERSERVYRVPYPQSTTEVMTAERVATLRLASIVGGDISASGREILLKTYRTVYYWCRAPAQSLWSAFELEPVTVPYIREPLGEAICWAPDDMGYYTVSEELFGIPARLYFYPRLSAGQ